MKIAAQIAKHIREVHFGGNWTAVNLKDTLHDIDWQQATTRIDSLNTIAALVFHMHYYVDVIINVLKGQPLNAHDKYSFDVPPIQSQQDWQNLVNILWTDAETLTGLVEQLPDEKLDHIFVNEKYGNYLRNFQGLIEHTHYHLGQIVLIKKMLQKNTREAGV
jgi:hypothetical protein